MRYQRVVASRREINFACQLFRISFFISALQENLANSLPECFRSKIALNPAAVADRNATALFGNNHCDRIGFLSDSQARAMAQTKTPIERFSLAYREDASGGGNASIAHDHPPIVKGGLRMKKSEEKLNREN